MHTGLVFNPPQRSNLAAPSKELTPPIPGWYSVLKHIIYKGDISYALSFDKDANELSILIVPQWLRPRSHPLDALGQDPNACCLFSLKYTMVNFVPLTVV